MDPLGDDQITRLLRLERYEKPPPDYFENFLHEFHRRQRERDELFRQPLWRICLERAEGFALRINIRSLAPAGIAVLVASAAVLSVRLYQQPDTTQLALQGSPVPSTPSTTKENWTSRLRCSFRRSTCSRLFFPQAEMFRYSPSTHYAPMNLSH
jgi:hypothetical protein